jgi:predicted nucleic acid-binding protein
MTRPLAVLDTNIVILLLSKKLDNSAKEVEADRKREAARAKLHEMQAKFRFGIPAVVVAELGRDGTSEKVLRALVKAIGRFRVLPLTHMAGEHAAEMSRTALQKRQPMDERGAVKFDTLICATAVAHEANCIVTENPRDFEKHIAVAKASIEVLVPSEPPKKGQLLLMQKPRVKK